MTFQARRKSPGEKALEVVTEAQAMLADMRREIVGIVAAEKRALGKQKSKEQPKAVEYGKPQPEGCDCEMDDGRRVYCAVCLAEDEG